MRMPGVPGLVAIALVFTARLAPAQAPRVIKAIPDNGDTDVDPALKEIVVEFDQDMSRDGHSICGGGESFPEILSPPRWKGNRTVRIPVKLKPDHLYELGINCPSFRNFRSEKGEAVVPYPISFQTRSAGKATPRKRSAVEENRRAIAALRRALDESYAYRDLRGVDWKAAFADFSGRLEKAETPAAFGRETARLLEKAGDLHVTVRVGDMLLGTARRTVSPNCDRARLPSIVPRWKKQSEAVCTGRFEDDIGYVAVTTWAAEDPKGLAPLYAALDEFADVKGLVVDVRLNSGGDESLARDFASCFVPAPAVYSRNVYRDPSSPDGFTKPLDRTVEPRKDRAPFKGRIAVLMGIENMSSCESFLLMMKQSPSCRTFGERSYGSSGNPKPHDLGNGVKVFLSSWKDLLPDGSLLEGVGIAPDEEVKAGREDFASGDPVLEAGLAWLRS
jgi:hypothetical protein